MRRWGGTRSLVAACLALLVLPAAHAGARSPHLAGTWFPVRYTAAAPSQPDETLRRLVAPGATLMREPAPPVFEFPRGEFGGLLLQDAALKSAQQWKPDTEPSLASACNPASILQAMTSPFPFEVHPATQLIVIRLEYFDLVRLVFMDGRAHPGPDYPHTKTGHSVGRWQNDVLVIDTTHLAPSIITTNGVAHTQALHVVERFRVDPDGKTLHYTQEFDDPAVMKSPGARYAQFKRQSGHVEPYECDPSYVVSIRNRGGRVSSQETELVQSLLEQTRQSQRAWVNGDSASYATERMSHTDRFTIFGPFGGPSPKGWSDDIAKIQANVAKAFQGGTSAIELVQSYVSGDLAVLVTIDRNEVRFVGHDRPLPWNLRTTQVYERDAEGQWKVVHRHADPLLPSRNLDQTLQLLAQ